MPKLNPEDQELYDAHLASLREEFPEADGAMVILDSPEYDPVRLARPDPNYRGVDPETGMELPSLEDLREMQKAPDRAADIAMGLRPEGETSE